MVSAAFASNAPNATAEKPFSPQAYEMTAAFWSNIINGGSGSRLIEQWNLATWQDGYNPNVIYGPMEDFTRYIQQRNGGGDLEYDTPSYWMDKFRTCLIQEMQDNGHTNISTQNPVTFDMLGQAAASAGLRLPYGLSAFKIETALKRDEEGVPFIHINRGGGYSSQIKIPAPEVAVMGPRQSEQPEETREVAMAANF